MNTLGHRVLCGLILALLSAVSIGRAQTPASAADVDIPTAPVVVDGVPLFRVRGVSSFTAPERAQAIAQRVTDAAADPAIDPGSLRSAEAADGVRIFAGDRVIMGIIDADGALEGVSRGALAAAHRLRIRDAIVDYRRARTPAALRESFERSAAATLALMLAIIALVWIWRRLQAIIRRRVEARIRTVGIQSFEVVRADHIRGALQSLLLGVRIVILLAVGLGYLGYVLGQWPRTRVLASSVSGLAFEPLRTIAGGIVANVPRFAFLAVLFVLIRVALRVIRLFFEAVEQGGITLNGFDSEWGQPTYKIVRILLVAFGLVVAYPYIPGSQSEAFKGVSLFIGIVFSLGSSSAVSNIIAGYMMTYRRAFKVGDRIKIGGTVGTVIQTRLQVTHLRSPKNEEVVIPNSQILGGEVLNYSSLGRERALLLHTEVSIGYDTPWRKVEAMLMDAAALTPGLGGDPAPFVLVKRLGEFAITYELNVPCGDIAAMPALYTTLHHNILDVFNEHGVQIMVPAYEGDPPEPKVVPPRDLYAAPAPAAPSPPATAPAGTRTA